VPEPVRGTQVLAIVVCYVGPIEEGEETLQPLRESMPPALDMVHPMPYTALQSMIGVGNSRACTTTGRQGFSRSCPMKPSTSW
jgi:hypothetical protein